MFKLVTVTSVVGATSFLYKSSFLLTFRHLRFHNHQHQKTITMSSSSAPPSTPMAPESCSLRYTIANAPLIPKPSNSPVYPTTPTRSTISAYDCDDTKSSCPPSPSATAYGDPFGTERFRGGPGFESGRFTIEEWRHANAQVREQRVMVEQTEIAEVSVSQLSPAIGVSTNGLAAAAVPIIDATDDEAFPTLPLARQAPITMSYARVTSTPLVNFAASHRRVDQTNATAFRQRNAETSSRPYQR